jgi:hypothetical protein
MKREDMCEKAVYGVKVLDQSKTWNTLKLFFVNKTASSFHACKFVKFTFSGVIGIINFVF